MARITIEEAREDLFSQLRCESIGDRIYEFAQELFQRYINLIECADEVTGLDVLDSGEEWYDGVQEEFYQAVYDRATKFLTNGE